MKKIDKGLHPRNLHNEHYDFEALIKTKPELALHVKKNKYGDLGVDFSSPEAVLALNQALLAHFYKIKNYTLPKDALIAPIPGRVDYLHYIADLLLTCKAQNIRGLDIGTGANCIYPILGTSVYGWDFVASDIEPLSLKSAESIIQSNDILDGKIECRLQSNRDNIFIGLISKKDKFTFTMCNPPFHTSEYEATKASERKTRNLSKGKTSKKNLNFAGSANELWCEGGELAFIQKMIKESVIHAKKCLYFTTLVSKKENLQAIYKALKNVKVNEVKTIEMKQGQKITRIMVWSFIPKQVQKLWFKEV